MPVLQKELISEEKLCYCESTKLRTDSRCIDKQHATLLPLQENYFPQFLFNTHFTLGFFNLLTSFSRKAPILAAPPGPVLPHKIILK